MLFSWIYSFLILQECLEVTQWLSSSSCSGILWGWDKAESLVLVTESFYKPEISLVGKWGQFCVCVYFMRKSSKSNSPLWNCYTILLPWVVKLQPVSFSSVTSRRALGHRNTLLSWHLGSIFIFQLLQVASLMGILYTASLKARDSESFLILKNTWHVAVVLQASRNVILQYKSRTAQNRNICKAHCILAEYSFDGCF